MGMDRHCLEVCIIRRPVCAWAFVLSFGRPDEEMEDEVFFKNRIGPARSLNRRVIHVAGFDGSLVVVAGALITLKRSNVVYTHTQTLLVVREGEMKGDGVYCG